MDCAASFAVGHHLAPQVESGVAVELSLGCVGRREVTARGTPVCIKVLKTIETYI